MTSQPSREAFPLSPEHLLPTLDLSEARAHLETYGGGALLEHGAAELANWHAAEGTPERTASILVGAAVGSEWGVHGLCTEEESQWLRATLADPEAVEALRAQTLEVASRCDWSGAEGQDMVAGYWNYVIHALLTSVAAALQVVDGEDPELAPAVAPTLPENLGTLLAQAIAPLLQDPELIAQAQRLIREPEFMEFLTWFGARSRTVEPAGQAAYTEPFYDPSRGVLALQTALCTLAGGSGFYSPSLGELDLSRGQRRVFLRDLFGQEVEERFETGRQVAYGKAWIESTQPLSAAQCRATERSLRELERRFVDYVAHGSGVERLSDGIVVMQAIGRALREWLAYGENLLERQGSY